VQLLQIQRSQSPVFTVSSLVNNNGQSNNGRFYQGGGSMQRRSGRHFHVDVRVGEEKTTGHGTSRKAAKRQAAIKMLNSMGYTVNHHTQELLDKDGKVVPPPPPPDPNAPPGTTTSNSQRKRLAAHQQRLNHQLQQQLFFGPGGYNRRVTFEDAVLATAMGLAGLPPLPVDGSSTAAEGEKECQGDSKETGESEDGAAEDKQDLIDERAGYVAATDLSVLAQQQAVLARELYIKHRFSAQRQNAIKIAKEFKATPGNSTTVQQLLEQNGKTMKEVLEVTSQQSRNSAREGDVTGVDQKTAGSTSDAPEEREPESETKPDSAIGSGEAAPETGILTAKQQMKLLCAAVGAQLSFHDHTKVGPPIEHVSTLTMTLGKLFQSEGTSDESVEQSQENASRSAVEMIAGADPKGPPIPTAAAGLDPATVAAVLSGGLANLQKSLPTLPVSDESNLALHHESDNLSASTAGETRVTNSSTTAGGNTRGDAATESMSHQTCEIPAEHCSETVNEAPPIPPPNPTLNDPTSGGGGRNGDGGPTSMAVTRGNTDSAKDSTTSQSEAGVENEQSASGAAAAATSVNC